MSSLEALHGLLCSLYGTDAASLRRFLRFGHEGEVIVQSLPGPSASFAAHVDSTIEQLKGRGLVNDTLARLRVAFPGRSEDIDRVMSIVRHADASRHPRTRDRFGGRVDNLGTVSAPSARFVGREGELGDIAARLAEQHPAVAAVAITGVPGVGKTRLALEYAHASGHQYDVRWWIRGADPQTGLVELGRTLDILTRPEDPRCSTLEVLTWLRDSDRWLLVLDNLHGPAALRGCLPSPSRGHIVITSRATAWRSVAVPLPIRPLARDAALRLLAQRSGRSDDDCADRVAHAVGDLPLALVHAGAYVEQTGHTFAEYLQRLDDDGINLLRDRLGEAGDYDQDNLATTLLLSLESLRAEHPEAAGLLEFLAFLDPDGVPLPLLRDYNVHLPLSLARLVTSPSDLERGLALLCGFSLLERTDDKLLVHRVTQAVVRQALTPDRRRTLAEAAFAWTDAILQWNVEDPHRSNVPPGIVEQFLAMSALEECINAVGAPLGWKLSFLSYFLRWRGQLARAREAGDRARILAEELVRREPHSVRARGALGAALEKLGDLEAETGNLRAAKELFQRCRELSAGLVGIDATNRQYRRNHALDLFHLGEISARLNDPKAARGYFESCRAIHEALILDEPEDMPAHRDLSLVLGALGELDASSGNGDSAVTLSIRRLDVASHLAQVNPGCARAQRDVTAALLVVGELELTRGDLSAARTRFRRCLEMREALARSPPGDFLASRDIAVVLDRLGDVEMRAGDLAAAQAYFERGRLIDETLVQSDASATATRLALATGLRKLGSVWEAKGDLAAARDLYQRSLEFMDALTALDPHDVDAAYRLGVAVDRLGHIEMKMGHFGAAHTFFTRARTVREELVGENPGDMRALAALSRSLDNLGELERKSRRFGAARDHFLRSLELRQSLAEQDPQSAEAARALSIGRERLATVAMDEGDLDCAHALLLINLELDEALADRDPHSAQALRDLAICLEKIGVVETDRNELQSAHARLQRSFAISETLATKAPQDSDASFRLVVLHQHLARLAEKQLDSNAQTNHLLAAKSILDELARAGKVRGQPVRERAQVWVTQRLAASR